ncbi:hypothetical protein A4G19_14480 [Pasteurellaceae bacterium Macca]|nr:hypothetical protein [Pasteurellaceae bacterium Macca]MCK3656106.1 hypothetical protein [Pasteurellaceae bacterium Macca]MCK3656127.1 hypothetical protein [Pasteurellaceae bacterium Macca]MCK3656145.1 hypothetical protein [Pasteurellaceae bacterium Macca]MCK3656852.1 hypothetical protein [Pasteurellaceae bacterium Macca]
MENKKMDYSFLNSTEIQAISINWQNSQNGTNLPIYPYFADTFDLFGELIEFAPVESKSGLKSLHNELSVIVKHLIELFPKPLALDSEEAANAITSEAISDQILKSSMVIFLAGKLLHLAKLADMRFNELEHGIEEGHYGAAN